MKTAATLRKSKAPDPDTLKGNAAKYLSYREAWARIKLACKQGFFLEAVAIEESIISDRLLSYLERQPGLVLRDATKGNLNQVIKKWHDTAADNLKQDASELENLESLADRLQKWRNGRNEVVHGMVKSKTSPKGDHINNFLQSAEAHAYDGEKLAREIGIWVRQQVKTKSIKPDHGTNGIQ